MSKLYNHVHARASQHVPHNVNILHKAQMSTGDRVADRVAATVGSWPFIITQSALLTCWIILNIVGIYGFRWDPMPFILLNLMLSFQAAYTGPVVMMSQNRQAAKDRLQADEDYHTNVKAEHEVLQVLNHLDAQDVKILEILERMEKTA